jgi:hypothetical protein
MRVFHRNYLPIIFRISIIIYSYHQKFYRITLIVIIDKNLPRSPESAMMNPPISPLSNFLGEILNTSVAFEIQDDNARLLAAGSCCTKRRRRRISYEFDTPSSSSPDQHRIVHKGSARWETHITSNDVLVTAPLRRKVYCEPEKMGSYQPMRSAQIPLKDLTGNFASSPCTTDFDDCKSSGANRTSDLLDEALGLLSD